MKYRLLPLLAGALVAHCSGAQFRATGVPLPDPTPTKAADAIAIPPAQLIEEFDLETARGKIDMVWVIDNSGSMADEAEQVRENFTRFLDSLSDTVDVKVALISKRTPDTSMGASTHVSLSQTQLAAGHKQIDADVGSTNALAILASAICAPTSTEIIDPALGGIADPNSTVPRGRMKICGAILDPDSNDTFMRGLENHLLVKALSGSLQNFFRPDAKRAFVVVTDDQATFVSDKNFLSLIRPSAPNGSGDPTIFAFRGTDASPVMNCSISMEGKEYEALAIATKGAVFDICEPDWSANFDRLSEGVGRIANTEFVIKDPAFKTVSAVLVDGVALKASEYSVTGRKVVVKAEVLQGSIKRITVRYIR